MLQVVSISHLKIVSTLFAAACLLWDKSLKNASFGPVNERGRFPTMQMEFQQLKKSAAVATSFGRKDVFLLTTATLQKASSLKKNQIEDLTGA
mgnify:CR=1 FL=1